MKNRVIIALLFLLCGVTMSLSAQEKETLVKVGDRVPEFEVSLFGGGKININDWRGKIVLINFWATWCPPCQMELKRVQKDIIDRFGNKNFEFIAISREDTVEQIREFREKNGYRFRMGLDLDRKIYSKFASAYIPRSFIINREGKIVYVSSGYDDKEFSKMLKKIEELLK